MIAGKSSGKTQIPEETNFTFVRGDSFEYEVEIWTTNATTGIEEAVDLSTAVIVGKVRDSKGTIIMPVLTSYSGNLLTISFDQTITKNLSKGKYEYDLEIYYNSKYTTVLRGWINLVGDVTYYDVLTQYFYTKFESILNSIYTLGQKVYGSMQVSSQVSLFVIEGKFYSARTLFNSYFTIIEMLRESLPRFIFGSKVTVNGLLGYSSPNLTFGSIVSIKINYTEETTI